MNTTRTATFALLLAALAAGPALAGDAAAGKGKIATCMACHGQDGKAIAPNYPNLQGQNEQYLLESMKAYKSGTRSNPIMAPMVAALSDADMADIAAWYASQSPCK